VFEVDHPGTQGVEIQSETEEALEKLEISGALNEEIGSL
jgi:hypothetical protein